MLLPVLSVHCTVAIYKTLAVTHVVESYCHQLQHQPRKSEAIHENTKFLKQIEVQFHGIFPTFVIIHDLPLCSFTHVLSKHFLSHYFVSNICLIFNVNIDHVKKKREKKKHFIKWNSFTKSKPSLKHLRAVFYKNHPGHGDQGWTNLSKLGPYTSIDEPLFMAMKIPGSVAPVFLDEICLISLI